METNKICQSCGMPLVHLEDFGTNLDHSKNEEYCTYCYQNGKFTSDCSLQEMVENNLQYLEEWNQENHTNYNEEEARKELTEFLATLNRWKCTCTIECASGYNPNCTCTSSDCHCKEN